MRGLTVGKDVIFVGISSARMKSRSRNEVNNISATGDFVVRSGIVELDRGKYSFKNFYNLNLFFREIYDLMIVDNVNLNLKYFYPPKIISKSSRILENYLASSLITLLEESRRSVNVLIEKNKVLKEENRNLHGILEEIKSAKMFKLWQFYCERRDSIKNWLQIHFYDKEK